MGSLVGHKRRSFAAIGAIAATTLSGYAAAQSFQRDIDADPVPTETPSLNFYGLPGVIDMPSADQMPDGQIAATVSHFAGTTRTSLTFQAFPRIQATFRYVGLRDFNSQGFETFRDRSFDVRFQLATEGRIRPAFSVGLQDLAGTGIYSGEYVVATKTFDNPLSLPGRVKISAGLGWGRLGSSGDIGAPFSETRPSFDAGSTGGEPSVDSWFRGPAAPFAGIEWNLNERWGLKAEYSSDAYLTETGLGIFERKSRLNFGVEYQYSDYLRLGAYYLYGSEIGISAQLQFNPRNPAVPKSFAGPRPVIVRPTRQANPAAWTTDWAANPGAGEAIRDAIAPELEEEGLNLEALSVRATEAELRIENTRYRNVSIAVGRAARVMARVLPPSVERFRITPVKGGLPLSTVMISRTDIERLEFEPDAAGRLLANVSFEEAPAALPGGVTSPDSYPRFAWSVGPYVAPSYFDPDEPVRVDAGIAAAFNYSPSPGWTFAGEVRGRLVGNVEDGRASNSVLPRVRTDAVQYAAATNVPLNNLYVSRQWKAGEDVYARITAGYLERMYGGVSGELLWKPQDSRLGLGVEANYARQRDFDQRLGFRDYDIVTGHVSAYYEFGGGYLGQLDVGRYLAGDKGATVTITREFTNGWKVGGFFTLTDVSAEEFGEGSFDKGINLTIPIDWFLGKPTTRTVQTTIRPVQRDGGARLIVPGRLYEQVRVGHQSDLVSSWTRVWE